MHLDAHAIEQAVERLDRHDKLRLIEVLARSLQRADAGPASLPTPAERRANLKRLRRDLDALPIGNPEDGCSNRDHDALIYGA
jgi:hypothetical protein